MGGLLADLAYLRRVREVAAVLIDIGDRADVVHVSLRRAGDYLAEISAKLQLSPVSSRKQIDTPAVERS